MINKTSLARFRSSLRLFVRLAFALNLLCQCQLTEAQLQIDWQAAFGGSERDVLGVVERTSDGGYILGGTSDSALSGNKALPGFGLEDVWLIKTDGSGNKEWEQVFGGNNSDYLSCVMPTSDGGYIFGSVSVSDVSGNKTSARIGNYDYWVVKLDGDGNKQWEKVYGGTGADHIRSIKSTSDGGYIIGGYSLSGVSGNKTNASFGFADMWLIKVDENGNKQWERVYGGSGSDVLLTVLTNSDGGYVLGGGSTSGVSGNKTNAGFGSSDYWLVKVDGNGNKEWERVFGGSGLAGGTGSDDLECVLATSDGGYLLAGQSDSGASGNKTNANFGGYDYWLVKVDGNGNKQWEAGCGGSGEDQDPNVEETDDGGYLVAGTSDSGVSGNRTTPSFGFYDCWLVKLDQGGAKQWEQVLGGSEGDNLHIFPAAGGGHILGGSSGSGISGNKTVGNAGSADYWLVNLTQAIPLALAVRPLTNGVFSLEIHGLTGHGEVFVYASTNLTDWTGIHTNPPVSGTLQFSEPANVNWPCRFYRAQEQ